MDYISNSLTTDQVNQASEERTKRLFVGFLSSALGVDQTYATDDAYIQQGTNQFIIANPDGTYSQVGRSVSNVQSVPVGLLQNPLVLLGLAFVVFKLVKG
jgi:t-SNARE complex subunit (syntaxin)